MALSRNILTRVLSALVLAPAAIAAIYFGGLWFLGLMLAACAFLSVEWARMTNASSWRVIAVAVGVGLCAPMIAAHFGQLAIGLVVMVACAAAAFVFARLRGQAGLDAAYGVFYLGWPAILLIWLRDGTTATGLSWTIFAFVVAWASDSLAYLVGSTVGGPKLWPKFSPNKTWSGFVGGVIAGTLAGWAIAGLFDEMGLSPFWGLLLGLITALATMAGDLWESALKRRYRVKDAGDLIPGHGGLLDRVDGLMFGAVVVALGRLLVLTFGGAA